MKNLLLISGLIFLSVNVTNAQWVTIPDPSFINYLQSNYPGCMNGNQMDTTCSAIVNQTTVTLISANISNLDGIQFFDNLEKLICYDNLLTSLPDLPATLTTLSCFQNQLTSLPVLPPLLDTLYAHYNQITVLPSLPASLIAFRCDDNQLAVIPALPPNLIVINCENNTLTALPSLPNTLKSLVCRNNQTFAYTTGIDHSFGSCLTIGQNMLDL